MLRAEPERPGNVKQGNREEGLAPCRGEILEERADCISGKLRPVERRRWETPQHIGKRFRGDGTGFGKRATAESFCQDGSGSNRRGAASAEETCFRNAPFRNERRQFEDVATDGVAHLHGDTRAGKLPGVARVAEVVENGFAEHF
jgi:hypothetical protein